MDSIDTSISGERLSPVGYYSNPNVADESGLVVLSMGLSYWIRKEDENFVVYVEEETATQVAKEISEYEQDKKLLARQLEEARALPEYSGDVVMPFLYIMLLLTGFWFQIRFHPWVVIHGSNSARHFVEELEWWRPLTALFLHADWLHLLKNAVSGLLFGCLVAGSLGPRRGWILILLTGVMGNTATALIRPIDSAPSIGASTAVFGALGILTAFGVTMAFRLRRFFHYSLVSKLVPLVFGLTLLAMQGMGGGPDSNTDVLAHVNGFGAGSILGAIFGWLHHQKEP